MKDEFGKKAGFAASVFYLFAPYHLVDMHFRNAIGEMVAFALLPLCFFFTKKVVKNKSLFWASITGLTISLLILSHIVASLIVMPLLVAYGLLVGIRERSKMHFRIIYLFCSILFGIFLACFYWLPISAYSKYIYWNTHSSVAFSTLSACCYKDTGGSFLIWLVILM